MALFELLSEKQRGLRVSEIGRDLGMPQPSVSMLLRSFVELGYLEYSAQTRLFTPTLRVMLLGAWIARRFSKPDSLSQRLAALHEQVGGETVYVAIQHAAKVQYVLLIEAQHSDRLSIASGHYQTITCSASGRMLLSLKPDDEVRLWVRRSNAETREHSHKVREQEFLKMMAAVRAQGHASTRSDSSPNLAATAISVPSPLGGTPLAIGVGGTTSRIDRRREFIVERLLELRGEMLNELC
jgi:DNA-binding IclR family transcriptional regulator